MPVVHRTAPNIYLPKQPMFFLSLSLIAALALGQMCRIIALDNEILPNLCDITTPYNRQVQYNTSSSEKCRVTIDLLNESPELLSLVNVSNLKQALPGCAQADEEEACVSEMNAYWCSLFCAPCDPCGDYVRDLLTNCPKTSALCLNLTSTNLPACTGPKFVGLPLKQQSTTSSSSSTVTAHLWCSVMLAGLVQRATSIHA